jgi:hypothetical protein
MSLLAPENATEDGLMMMSSGPDDIDPFLSLSMESLEIFIEISISFILPACFGIGKRAVALFSRERAGRLAADEKMPLP